MVSDCTGLDQETLMLRCEGFPFSRLHVPPSSLSSWPRPCLYRILKVHGGYPSPPHRPRMPDGDMLAGERALNYLSTLEGLCCPCGTCRTSHGLCVDDSIAKYTCDRSTAVPARVACDGDGQPIRAGGSGHRWQAYTWTPRSCSHERHERTGHVLR